LAHHEVATAYERGWSKLKNGELLDAAEKADFAVLLTTNSSLKFQQNLDSRRIAVVVLSSTSWPRMQHAVDLAPASSGIIRSSTATSAPGC